MGWVSIREYTEQAGVSASTVRRQIRERRLFAKKFGRDWFVRPPEYIRPPSDGAEQAGPIDLPERLDSRSPQTELIDFSSKALNHYLILSEKLIAEKDLRIAERDHEVTEKRQLVAELEAYVELLEQELARQKQKPEGWF